MRLLRGQVDMINEVIDRTGLWLNPTAFVREAVNEKLARTLSSLNPPQAGMDGDRPRDVQDLASRRG